MHRHPVLLCTLALFLFLPALSASAADVGLNLSVAKQAVGRGESDAKMAFLQLRIHNDFHNNFELVNEITVARLENPVHGYVVGINEVGRVNFVSTRKSSPFLDVGVGVNYFGPHEGVPEVTGPLQFTLVAGAGYRFNAKNGKFSWALEYRLTHFSNAETMTPNVGLNLHTAGISFMFK